MQHLQLCRQDPALQPSRVSASATALVESWEKELVAFLQERDAEVKDNLVRNKAQEFANELDGVRRLMVQLNPIF